MIPLDTLNRVIEHHDLDLERVRGSFDLTEERLDRLCIAPDRPGQVDPDGHLSPGVCATSFDAEGRVSPVGSRPCATTSSDLPAKPLTKQILPQHLRLLQRLDGSLQVSRLCTGVLRSTLSHVFDDLTGFILRGVRRLPNAVIVAKVAVLGEGIALGLAFALALALLPLSLALAFRRPLVDLFVDLLRRVVLTHVIGQPVDVDRHVVEPAALLVAVNGHVARDVHEARIALPVSRRMQPHDVLNLMLDHIHHVLDRHWLELLGRFVEFAVLDKLIHLLHVSSGEEEEVRIPEALHTATLEEADTDRGHSLTFAPLKQGCHRAVPALRRQEPATAFHHQIESLIAVGFQLLGINDLLHGPADVFGLRSV